MLLIFIIIICLGVLFVYSIKKEKGNTLKQSTKLKIDKKEKFIPIYWKDDDNIIATKNEEGNECGIYSINLENSTIDEINTIDNTFYIRWISNNIIPYIHNKNLWIYDAEKNTTKEIYNLNSFINEFKTEEMAESDSEIQRNLAFGGLTSSDKYIFLSGIKGEGEDPEKYLKIIDSETGEVTEVIQKSDNLLESIFYSKLSKKFYGFSILNKLYSFGIENPKVTEEINSSPGPFNLTTSVDINGEFAYYSTVESVPKFIKYDIKNNKIDQLEISNPIKLEKNQSVTINYLGNKLVYCDVFDGKNVNGVTLSNGYRYFGRINENRINILGKVTSQETNKAALVSLSLVNKNGDKIFNFIDYYSSEIDHQYEYTVERITQ